VSRCSVVKRKIHTELVLALSHFNLAALLTTFLALRYTQTEFRWYTTTPATLRCVSTAVSTKP